LRLGAAQTCAEQATVGQHELHSVHE
jgi:hypothetical protein